jgi:hypothetical protein
MSRTFVARRFVRLAVQALETRAVPANSLTLIDDPFAEANISVSSVTNGKITIATTNGDAMLSVPTLQNALATSGVNEVIVTTAVASGGTDAHQPGNISWDANTAGDLDFTGFGTGKTLTFRTTAGTSAVGDVDLTSVGFHNTGDSDQISLNFDTTATNGSVGFHADQPDAIDSVSFDDASVLNLTVAAGTGGFTYEDAAVFDDSTAGGNISVNAGAVSILHAGGLAADGNITVTADTVNLAAGSGLLATGSVSVTGTTFVDADTAPLTATNGSLSVEGGAITMTVSDLSAQTTVTVTGTDSVALDTASVFGSGDTSITSAGLIILDGLLITPLGALTVSGMDVTLSGTTASPAGDLNVTGSSSVTVDTFSTLIATNISLTSPGPLGVADSDLTATANVTLTGSDADLEDTTVTASGDLAVSATDADPTVQLSDDTLSAGGNLPIVGAIELGGASVSITGAGRDSVVSFSSTIDGATDLLVSGGTVSFGGNVGGVTPIGNFTLGRGLADLGANNLSAAMVGVGDAVIDPLGEATLGGRGTITLSGVPLVATADLTVFQDGNLAPGGLGTIGTLTVNGNVVFNGGDFAVDLGAQSDQLVVHDNPATAGNVEGNITINVGRLGGGLGTGSLPNGSPDVKLIDFTGNLTGQFFNAPLDVPVLAGTDAVRVTHYGPAATGLTVGQVPVVPNGVFNTADPDDGTLVTARLTGGGQLVGGTIWNGQSFLVVRNANAASALAITTRANGSDTIATFGAGILINGPLAAFTAPRIIIGDQLRATGAVKTASFLDLISQDPNGTNATIDFGGPATSTTTITARNILGSVKVAGTLTKLTATGALGSRVNSPGLEDSTIAAATIGTISGGSISAFIRSGGTVTSVTATRDFLGGVTAKSLGTLSAGTVLGSSAVLKVTGPITTIKGTGSLLALDLTAASIGSVTVAKGTLSGVTSGWNVAGGIIALTAGAIDDLNLTAKFLGTLKVTGTPDLGGVIQLSTFTVTGNDGSAAKFGIKSLTAAGTVSESTFDVKAGNIGPVKVGRFLSSRLYLNYTPPASLGVGFNAGGAFGTTGFKLTSFATTAVPIGDPTNPLQWAYQDSEIAADSIGTVTLSGLNTDDSGTAFGIKVHKPGMVVVVKTADAGFPANLRNKALTASTDPIAGDFYFIKV